MKMKKIISALVALTMVSGLAVVPSYARTKDQVDDPYRTVTFTKNHDTETQADAAPDGSAGYLKVTEGEYLALNGDGGIGASTDMLMSVDFRFDSADGKMRITNKDNAVGPIFAYDNGALYNNLKTPVKLFDISLNTWYTMELQGRLGKLSSEYADKTPFLDMTLYSWNNGVKTKVGTVKNVGLRNFATANSGVNRLTVEAGVSIDNEFVASLYPNRVTVAPTVGNTTALKGGESLQLGATAYIDDYEALNQSVTWSVYNEAGTAELGDDNITVDQTGLVKIGKKAQTKNIKVRATSTQTGNAYGQYAIAVSENTAASGDKYDDLVLSTPSDKHYVTAGESITITATAKDESGQDTDVDGDLEWVIQNESKTRTVSNNDITITNAGVLTVGSDVIPQKLNIRAKNLSGSIQKDFAMEIRPNDMNYDGVGAFSDTYDSSDACEEMPSTDAATLMTGSIDGSAYYKTTGEYDLVKFVGATGTKDVVYSADIKFAEDGSGVVIKSNDNGKLGFQLKRSGTAIGKVGSGEKFTSLGITADPDAWYRVYLMVNTGNNSSASYGRLILYKYKDGQLVNPSDDTSTEPFITSNLESRNLYKDTGNHLIAYAGTCVDNVVNRFISPNQFDIKVEPNILLAGNSAQATVTAKWNGATFPKVNMDTVQLNIYDTNDEFVLDEDSGITIDNEGKITVSAMAMAQTVYVGVKAKGTDTHTSVPLEIKSSDIFEVTGVGFNKDYTKLVALDVNKAFSYDKEVTFVIVTYDANNALKSVNVKSAYGSEIKLGDSTITVDCDMTNFNKETDSLRVFTWTKLR